MILKQRTSKIKLKRSVIIESDKIKIIDEIFGLKSFEKIIVGSKASFIYVPSSRWYQKEDLKDEPYQILTPSNYKTKTDRILIERKFALNLK